MSSSRPSGLTPGPQLRILTLEDSSATLAETIRGLFQSGTDSLELTSVSTLATLIPTINLIHPQLIFVDLEFEPVQPIALIRSVSRAAPDIPLIVLTDAADRNKAELCLHEGATDYVLKGHADAKVVARVLRAALERHTVAGLTDLLRDPATGLFSKEGFAALANRAVQHAQRSGGRMILLTAEITNLEKLGGEFGPATVECAVREVASLLRANFRRTDVVARLFEARFAVLACDALEPTAAIMRQRLSKHLSALNVSRAPWGEIELKTTAAFWNAAGNAEFPELTALLEDAR